MGQIELLGTGPTDFFFLFRDDTTHCKHFARTRPINDRDG